VMDYWLGDQRVKGSVLVMGKRGARLRLNALNPNGDQVAADLACDGIEFRFVDINNNCQMSGPCTGDSIAQLLHVSLEPDDFLLLAVGTTPVLHDATGTVTWDERTGYETVDLESADGQLRQVIVFDGREGHRDVISSRMLDAKGNPTWILENTGFSSIKTTDGLTLRVPAKTRFRQPSSAAGAKADLLVDWKERSINLDLQAGKFDLPVPDGLRRCN
jgi:hypothetical protein